MEPVNYYHYYDFGLNDKGYFTTKPFGLQDGLVQSALTTYTRLETDWFRIGHTSYFLSGICAL